MTGEVVGASGLFLRNGALAALAVPQSPLRPPAEGTPRVLIRIEVMDYEALLKEGLTVDRSVAAIATHGAGGLDVEKAVLEPNRTIVARMNEVDRDAMRQPLEELKAMVAGFGSPPRGR